MTACRARRGPGGLGKSLAAGLLYLLSGAASAQEASPAFFSLVSENDIYAPRQQDRHYSNGLRLGFGLEAAPDRWYSWLTGLSAFEESGATRRIEVAIGQNIYTPEWFRNPQPVLDDRPYAGWLYGELALTSNVPGMEEGLVLNAGIVGPAAMGEFAQTLNHELVGDPRPRGWEHQLRNEPALLLHYRRSWFLPLLEDDELRGDLVPRLGASLGNVFSDIGSGLVLRLGNHLPEREIPLRIRPGLSGSSSFVEVRRDEVDWMVFGEIQGRAVARNIFLDGNTFADSLSVDKRQFVLDTAVGLTLGFGQFRNPVFLSLSFVWRGREFKLQRGSDNFGSALIGIQF